MEFFIRSKLFPNENIKNVKTLVVNPFSTLELTFATKYFKACKSKKRGKKEVD